MNIGHCKYGSGFRNTSFYAIFVSPGTPARTPLNVGNIAYVEIGVIHYSTTLPRQIQKKAGCRTPGERTVAPAVSEEGWRAT